MGSGEWSEHLGDALGQLAPSLRHTKRNRVLGLRARPLPREPQSREARGMGSEGFLCGAVLMCLKELMRIALHSPFISGAQTFFNPLIIPLCRQEHGKRQKWDLSHPVCLAGAKSPSLLTSSKVSSLQEAALDLAFMLTSQKGSPCYLCFISQPH